MTVSPVISAWQSPLKIRIRRRTFLSCWPGIRPRQWLLLSEALTRLVIVLKLHLFLPRCMKCRRGLAMIILSVCPSVCLSVRLSVTRVNCDKTMERSVQIFIPHKRLFSLVFPEKEWLVGATPSTWNFGSTGPRWSKFDDFQPIIARSSSAVTPSEKSSINANRKSTTRFPMSLRWSSYVAPKFPKGGLKNAKRPISAKKLQFAWRKSATKFFLCENCQRQSCKALLA